jgi:ribonucleoside-diphosphate reductase alpha chain
MGIHQVRRRDGSLQPFDPTRIANAIQKALQAAGAGNGTAAWKATRQVVRQLERAYGEGRIPGIEDIQDVVVRVLAAQGLGRVARAYQAYRTARQAERAAAIEAAGLAMPALTPNAVTVLKRRYLLRNDAGRIIETPAQLFRRVARALAMPERRYRHGPGPARAEDAFFRLMSRLDFLPNTPTLMNAGTDLGMLSACFVLPVEDSLEGIFDCLKWTALIHQAAGGTGFSFSRLRPAGDIVKSTKGVASGPVSFMRIFDMMTDIIKQGGKRRGANMGILHCSHPDISDFINAKTNLGWLTNFNTSVAVTERFMQAVRRGGSWALRNPRDGAVVRTVHARELFDAIIQNAWKTGDPGLIFIDEINRRNPTRQLGDIEATNPCGEQPLHPFESCNLGSINLARFVRNGDVDWDRLTPAIRASVRFLDNVIDANKYTLPQIAAITHANRRIGLGMMGWAEMLIQLGIRYDSAEAVRLAERFMARFNREAREASNGLAEERGSFPNFGKSVWKGPYAKTRNATVTTIAPTGTLSIIAGASSGIEPLFAVSYVREVLERTKLPETSRYFEAVARERGFYNKGLMMKIARRGTVAGMREVPKDAQELFRTALDIAPEWHVRMQAAFQKHTDNAVSKTINLPANASAEDVQKAYLLAWKLKCKGITIYRYGSKPTQVLYIGKQPGGQVVAKSEYGGGPLCEECVH